jgi:cytochrome c-type biogenesis protein CcmI
MTAFVLIALVALAAAAFVLAPLFRKDALEAERVAKAMSEEEDLHARYGMAVAGLRDLEEDRATGKIGDADFASQQAELQARALELMRRIDEQAAGRA